MKRNATLTLHTFFLFLLLVSFVGCGDFTLISSHTVTFKGNGGTLASRAVVDVIEGEKIDEPQIPLRTGFLFIEWQKDDGTAFDFTTEIITADITLTAIWRSSYTLSNVTLMANATSGEYSVNYTYSDADGLNTTGTPEIKWFISDNPDGSDSTQVSTETTYTPTGVNRYKYLTAFVRVRASEGEYTTEMKSETVFPGFSTEATNNSANLFTPIRTDHASVVFNNRMWVIGGQGEGFTRLNDVWSSFDGARWIETTSNSGFPVRTGHASVVLNGRVWVIGGRTNGVSLNDVWSSNDGARWTEIMNDDRFPIRFEHTAVVFNNRIWVIGGFTGDPLVGNTVNDVWSSADGSTWTQVRTNGAANGFPARYAHASVVFDNKIWVIGGLNGTNSFNDVWSSTNGVTWRQATANAAFIARYDHTSVVFDNKIWVIGGEGENFGASNDVWSSTDGVTWIEVRNNGNDEGFPARNDHSSLVFDNKIWVIGGDNRVSSNDVWY